MTSSRDKANHQRAALALSFEPDDDGYLYYHWRWSRGIPVTAEEREAYLAIPVLGSRRAWRKSISGRPTAPHRAFRPVQQKLLARMPISMIVVALLVGIALAGSGLVELQTLSGLARAMIGLMAIVFATQIILAKYKQARGR
ncbi:hypothetical protein [Stakelama tenebrarum]|uniref:Uncharacterized protein n=1 Tax=Stakelama tenebrarum TaxID=2711215 RepID=A0A6G6Y9I2_9SPHN|nr:hypothetical protein [Sphingosinithalassobacter tenebrarum]QIG81233.1 hypothetical protein G5C33_16585 [Sphingosinithalassobacter tenebrarum]